MEGTSKTQGYFRHFIDNAHKEGSQVVGGALTGYGVKRALEAPVMQPHMDFIAKRGLAFSELFFKGRKLTFHSKGYAKWRPLFGTRRKPGFYGAASMLKRVTKTRAAMVYSLITSAAASVTTGIGSIFSFNSERKAIEKERQFNEGLSALNTELEKVAAHTERREKYFEQVVKELALMKEERSEPPKSGWRSWLPW